MSVENELGTPLVVEMEKWPTVPAGPGAPYDGESRCVPLILVADLHVVVVGVEIEVRVVVPALILREAGRRVGAAPGERDIVDDRRLVGVSFERELGGVEIDRGVQRRALVDHAHVVALGDFAPAILKRRRLDKVLIGVASGTDPIGLIFPAPLRHERQGALAAELIVQLDGVVRRFGAERLIWRAAFAAGLSYIPVANAVD